MLCGNRVTCRCDAFQFIKLYLYAGQLDRLMTCHLHESTPRVNAVFLLISDLNHFELLNGDVIGDWEHLLKLLDEMGRYVFCFLNSLLLAVGQKDVVHLLSVRARKTAQSDACPATFWKQSELVISESQRPFDKSFEERLSRLIQTQDCVFYFVTITKERENCY